MQAAKSQITVAELTGIAKKNIDHARLLKTQ